MPDGKPPLSPFVAGNLPEELTWSDRPEEHVLATLPACPAVYLLLADARVPVQLATTQHLRRLAVARLLEAAESRSGRANVAEITRGIRWRRVFSAFEGRWWYYRLAREMYPKHYRRLISFGPAWFLSVDWAAPVPEIVVSERIWQEPGEFVGPWPTHDTCQQALAGLWDLFELCRYPEQVRRAPAGQRCAYAEMGRCDAPCDGSVPLERYVERSRAAWEFACGAVRPWIDAAKQRMKQAAAEERFEHAAQLKHQLAFAWKWHDRWLPVIRPAEDLNYLLAVPVTRRKAWKLFLFRRGSLTEGPICADRHLPTKAAGWLRGQWEREPELVEPVVRTGQTWLVAHFCQSKEGAASLVLPLGARQPWEAMEDALRQLVTARTTRASAAEAAVPSGDENAPPAVAS